jgi:hypothetical protein
VVATMLVLARAVPAPSPPTSDEPRITRLFIPAIKAECRIVAGVGDGTDIGYTFTPTGALTTIDRDGSYTGLDPHVLGAFNICLARYPIRPEPDWPHNHYSRNLLYDYFAGVLKPCLSERVAGVPGLPSRADFVVRLYSYDPFRVIAPQHTLRELIALTRACPPLPPYLGSG